jgi:hypothetical protein
VASDRAAEENGGEPQAKHQEQRSEVSDEWLVSVAQFRRHPCTENNRLPD